MNDRNMLQNILNELYDKLKILYGGDLYKVILYGSYARGDYNEESDIDVIALVNSTDELIKERNNEIDFISSRLSLKHDISIFVNVKNRNFFEHWKKDMPYFRNIVSEGIEVSA